MVLVQRLSVPEGKKNSHLGQGDSRLAVAALGPGGRWHHAMHGRIDKISNLLTWLVHSAQIGHGTKSNQHEVLKSGQNPKVTAGV